MTLFAAMYQHGADLETTDVQDWNISGDDLIDKLFSGHCLLADKLHYLTLVYKIKDRSFVVMETQYNNTCTQFPCSQSVFFNVLTAPARVFSRCSHL